MADTIITLLIVYLVLILVILAVGLTDYILSSIGMFNMGKKRGFQMPWLAFIPYGREYFLGCLSGNVKIGKKTLNNTPTWLIVLPILVGGISAIFMFATMIPVMMTSFGDYGVFHGHAPNIGGMIASFVVFYLLLIVGAIIYSFVKYTVIYNLFYIYTDRDRAIFYLLLAMFVPFAYCILLFKLRSAEVVNKPESPNSGEGREFQAAYAYSYQPQQPVQPSNYAPPVQKITPEVEPEIEINEPQIDIPAETEE